MPGNESPAVLPVQRVGGGRSPRLAALIVGLALVAMIGLGLSDRQPAAEQRADLPAPSPVAVASPSHLAAPSGETPGPSPTPHQIRGDDGLASPVRITHSPVTPFLALVETSDGLIETVWLAKLEDGSYSGRVDFPARLWRQHPLLTVEWLGQGVERRQQITQVNLSMGSGGHIGLPFELARGQTVLPVAEQGVTDWTFDVLVVRPHMFSEPHEMKVEVRLAQEPNRCVVTGRYRWFAITDC
ncbi:hypothetical protein BH23CHL7_BH23CHL7_09880 [soil metagenome]